MVKYKLIRLQELNLSLLRNEAGQLLFFLIISEKCYNLLKTFMKLLSQIVTLNSSLYRTIERYFNNILITLKKNIQVYSAKLISKLTFIKSLKVYIQAK